MSEPCQVFEQALLVEEPSHDPNAAFAHAADCPRCSALSQAVRDLDALLPELAGLWSPPAAPPEGTQVDLPQNANPEAAMEEARSWHVTLDDGESGPLSIDELERLLECGAIDGRAMVWRQGMADWMVLEDVGELGELCAHIQPGAEAEEPSQAPVSWRPSAAQSLSELVTQETQTAAREPPRQEAPARPELPALAPPPQLAGWQIPKAPRERTSPVRRWHVVAASLGSALAAAAVVVLVLRVTTPVLPRQAAPATPAATPAVAPAAAPVLPQEPSGITPKDAESLEQPAAKPTSSELPQHTSKHSSKHTASAKAAPMREAKKNDLDDLLDERPSNPPAKAKLSLSKDDIFGGVRAGMRSVQVCLAAARKNGELVPGRYTFVLDWTIAKDGSTQNPRMKGPAEVLGTSLPVCFASKMKAWRFPASQKATPIANFPFGPIVIR